MAILSSPLFDAHASIDVTSLTFGRVGNEESLVSVKKPRDVNHDGLMDVVAHFKVISGAFSPGDTEANLNGSTLYDEQIMGSDEIRTVPGGKKKGKK